jgi:endoglucanase
MRDHHRTWSTVVAGIAVTAVAASLALLQPARAQAPPTPPTAPTAPTAQDRSPVVRVNQVGYTSSSSKVAFAMLARPVAAVRFEVITPYGVAYRGTSTDDLGSWNSGYQAVYQLSFTGVRTPGQYQVKLLSPAAAVSPEFIIGDGSQLYRQLVDNAVQYFTSERDGPDVDSAVLGRQPANLTDKNAYVYADPASRCRRTSRTRRLRRTSPRTRPPARRSSGKVLYAQVGIGNGSASTAKYPLGQIQGDYNFWFLPQQEDHLNVKPGGNPGPTAYFVKYRPVFEAAPPGQPVSPDLAGRFAADFALGAQLDASTDPAQAQHMLGLARGVYAMAKTTDVGQIVTAFPNDYYPGTEWKSDMAWGAAEIALADEATGAPAARLRADLATAARWARAYIAQGHPADGDTFNLYDDGAVAEAELLQAIRQASQADGFTPVIAPRTLLDDMAAQLRTGESWAKGDPFALGTQLGPSDAAPHAFGLFITDALYQEYGGSGQYQAFAQQQLNFALGANAWGSSFVVGAGTVFPHCMQSEIANLAGSLTGRGNIQLGAVTDGPSSAANFVGLGTVSGMRACSAGNFAPFDTKTAAFQDNVVSWPSVEPADDYTADSLLAFALSAAGLG